MDNINKEIWDIFFKNFIELSINNTKRYLKNHIIYYKSHQVMYNCFASMVDYTIYYKSNNVRDYVSLVYGIDRLDYE